MSRADCVEDRAHVRADGGKHLREPVGYARRVAPTCSLENERVVGAEADGYEPGVAMRRKKRSRKLKLRACVRDVEREVRPEWATPVVRPCRRDEATGRLTGAGCVGGAETERLTDIVGIADEVVRIAVLESRLGDVSENHAVTESQIGLVVVRHGGGAPAHE